MPGVPAGAGEVHRRWGRLPWHRVVEPAVTLAASGVVLPTAQAHTLIAVRARPCCPARVPRSTPRAGGCCRAANCCTTPGLDKALDIAGRTRVRPPSTPARSAAAIVEAVRDGRRLRSARRTWPRTASPDVPVDAGPLAGMTVSARADLSGTVATIAALPPRLADHAPRPASGRWPWPRARDRGAAAR